MSNKGSTTRPRTWRRVAALLVVALAAVLLTWALVAAQPEPDIDAVKTGPEYAFQGDVITYTILVTNHGLQVENAVLSDAIPNGLMYESCQYRFEFAESYGQFLDCGPPPELWTVSMPTGWTVRTYVVFEVVGGTLNYVTTNAPELTADGVPVPIEPVTTILNPAFEEIYLPIVLNNFD